MAQASENFDIILKETVFSVWRAKWYMGIFSGVFLVIAFIYLNFATFKYSIDLLVTPVGSENSMFNDSLGPLAEIAGIHLPKSTAFNTFGLYTEALTSYPTAELLFKRTDLMKLVFQSEWDDDSGKWVEPDSFLRRVVDKMKSVLGVPVYEWKAPSSNRLRLYIEDKITVKSKRNSLSIVITMLMSDPQFGAELLEALHSAADDVLRDRALTRVHLNIAYLKEKLYEESIAEYRAALIDIISRQERLRMSASSGLPFVAEPFGPPSTSPYPTHPNSKFVLILGFVFGCIIGLIASLLRHYFQSQKAMS